MATRVRGLINNSGVFACMTTTVLVPGAWLGGWVWRKVTPLLQQGGCEVHPVTLTGMGERVHLASREAGLETAVEDVLNVMEYNDLDNVVLVGHSFAGKVVAAAADRVPEKVSVILYLDAFRPSKVRAPQGSFDPSEFGPVQPGQWTVPLTEKVLESVGRDVQGPDREWLMSKATPWPMKLMTDPVALSERFDSVRSAYIFCTEGGDPVDEILGGKWGRLDGPHRVIESGHWPMITKPQQLARDILSLTGEGAPLG
jgi:pimeloyl-ACP methyl ester carboxylesterase